ncbi:MAG: DUF4831 family protein [Prevotellaceae bacterium]|jgi:hypothetical protein|nr:DUF4831 family protein [Prevotellaceae bacterium]
MKRTLFFITLNAMTFAAAVAQTPLSQTAVIPPGAVVYALPSTTIEIRVEALHERFTAGPYARFAQKYLGIDAETEDVETFRIQNMTVQAFTEADASQMYYLEIKDKKAEATFLQFSRHGLLVSLDNAGARPQTVRHGRAARGRFDDRGTTANIGREQVTLYKPAKAGAGLDKVPVQQSQLVEKNPERRAEEAANVLFNLREKRISLITGEAEGALSHDGLQAALAEIRRLEEEYLSLFLGKTTTDEQSAVFFVTPVATQKKHLYVAFRLSDTEGLLAPDNLAGRPVTLELTVDKKNLDLPSVAPAGTGHNSKTPHIAYRIPETVRLSLHDGQTSLLQTRLPVYQLGAVLTFPVSLRVK